MNENLIKYFKGDDLAASTWYNKYRVGSEETPEEMHQRLAKAFAEVEFEHITRLSTQSVDNIGLLSELGLDYYECAIQKDKLSLNDIYFSILAYFDKFKFIVPAGSVMASLGSSKLASLSNCFVIDSPKDSISGIMQQCNEQAQLMKYRGGVGFDISTLRPSSAIVNNAANTSTGAASFMDLFSHVTNTVAQNGRRGALMLSCNIKHPDIQEFITMKQDLTKVTGANVSVLVTNDFMLKAMNNEDYFLTFPINAKLSDDIDLIDASYNKLIRITDEDGEPVYIKRVKAKELWNLLTQAAHKSAEPGILFIDRIHGYSPDGSYQNLKAVSTNPCGEIPMGPYDSCRLMHINLTSFVINPFKENAEFDYESFKQTVYTAMTLSDTLVTLEERAIQKIIDKVSPDEALLWNKIQMTGNFARRTGLGFTGLADVFAMMGVKYGSKASLNITDLILETKFYTELECSIDMAILRGQFPYYNLENEYDEGVGTNSFYKVIREKYPELVRKMNVVGRRNASWSTLAPTGTVSLMTGTTSGIEPVFLPYYNRKRKCSSPNDRVDFVDAVGEKFTNFIVIHPMFKRWIMDYTDCKSEDSTFIDNLSQDAIEEFYKQSPWYQSTANDIDWKSRIELQAIVQRYTTHAISSTINLPSSTTPEEVRDIYEYAWAKGLKGLTIYRDGCRDGILTSVENKSTPTVIPNTTVVKRPKVLEADYHQVKSQGRQYIVLVGLLNGKPYEIFTFVPSFPVDIKPHKGQIVKIKKGHYTYNSEHINIQNLQLSVTNIEEKSCSLYTSMLLRHNADIEFIIATAKKVNDNISSFTSAMCRILSKYIPDKEVKGEVCPVCGEKLIRSGGCISCLNCDYSKCL